jgi:hypothetical protein
MSAVNDIISHVEGYPEILKREMPIRGAIISPIE